MTANWKVQHLNSKSINKKGTHAQVAGELSKNVLETISHSVKVNRTSSYSEKNQNGMTVCFILSNSRICTILIEAPTPLDRTSRIKMNKNNALSNLFRIRAKKIYYYCLGLTNLFTFATPYISITLGDRSH